MPFSTISLNDGNAIPQIAFGTGSVNKGTDVSDQIEQAIETGFWHIDTAQAYGNEESVGDAIRESGLTRKDLYITTKFSGLSEIEEAIQASLKKIGVSYVDLYLVHNPRYIRDDFAGAWAKFERIKAQGLAKSIGVSNFTVNDLQTLLKTAKVTPAANQISFHPYNYQQNRSLLEFSAKNGIIVEGYSPLASITKFPGGPVDKAVQVAADRLGVSPAQVLLSWVKSKGVVIVTTSSKKSRLEEYLAVGDLPAIEEAGAQGPSVQLIQRIKGRVIPLIGLCLVAAAVRWLV
ncbi:hypothetical protein M422DRAFT_71623 [Sphaerobolus stellatus SS14]|uniref:NADP-dependent oxidoreductase domain-containing protein n=1 Tax=Sphaerobolus stellatus (strain SS14) TaxID=990650 RepID=A0A0C9U0L0_SPHS4|nr:hypothetical protein M422DRAFT_71623 [Sphaerobolus stellatus SS14]